MVVGTSVYMASGTYVDTLTAVNGCDSIVNLVLVEDAEIVNKLKTKRSVMEIVWSWARVFTPPAALMPIRSRQLTAVIVLSTWY